MKTRKNEPLSKETEEFIARMFVCEPPCDSYGICEACMEETIFLAGYNFGYRASEKRVPGKQPDGSEWYP
jgi:hypothetical protein